MQLSELGSDTGLRIIVMVIEFSLALTLIAWMRSSQKGQKGHWLFFLKLLLYGGLVALVAAYIEIKYSFNLPLLEKTAPHLVGRYGNLYDIINTFSASIIEELAKYVVAVFTILNSRQVRKLSDAILYLIIIGLGFSLVEDVIFMLNPDTSAPYRLLSFYVHSGTSAIVGYSLGRFMSGVSRYGELVISILGAIGLHFAYNLSTIVQADEFSFYFTAIITMYISLQIFILFRKAIEEEYRLGHRHTGGTTHKLLSVWSKA